MPFIGTRHVYRHQGMCRRLFSVIESAFQQLKVKLLVIPATADFIHVWLSKFGFHRADDSLKKEIRSMNLLAFPGIDVLHKELLAPESASDTAMEKHMDCKTSFNPFDEVKEEEEGHLMESPPQRNSSEMAFLDHIIRSPVDTGETAKGVVYGSGDDDCPATARQ
ncbi:unnamed protein product [Microthlaspi erraticum]|uniref:Increased DNA methylation 1 C-terminal domain-containing protein n=1 Tax=Microthlaspi erraticum TaxID=1685480 RepID=A0A6D2JZG4_9BRAS|nr:unnamed protein product [Microthlaspi erraticum]